MFSKAENIVAVTYSSKKWDATADCAMAYLEKKESADVHYYMAKSMKEKGETQKAVDHADKAIALVRGSRCQQILHGESGKPGITRPKRCCH